MSISTLMGFLFGSRNAIEKIAETRSAVWLGLLFVISAGFAREYDGEDLLHEPWHLGLPLAASLATSFLLFLLICFAGGLAQWNVSTFVNEYRRFLGLYWMTAPLAWLYALPVERWVSAAEATQVNLSLLGLVALWRVVLMIRIILIIYSDSDQAKWINALFIVMFFADTVLLTLLYLTPLPVVSIMSGIQLPESEQILDSTSLLAGILGVLLWPVWLIGALVVMVKYRLRPYAAEEQLEKPVVSLSAWSLGVLALLVWIPILPFTQSEQQLAYEVERDLRSGKIERAVTTMTAHERSDFPPHWDPPPRIGYRQESPVIIDVLEIGVEHDASAWILELYQQKLEASLGSSFHTRFLYQDWDNEEYDRYLSLFEQLPVSPEFLETHQDALQRKISDEFDRTDEQKARLRKLLGIAQDESTSGSEKIELEIGPLPQP